MKKEDYPCILEGLFPGHPARRLWCSSVYQVGDDSLKKEVVTKPGGARLKDYAQHLSHESRDGAGALGVIPTYPERPKEKSRWLVQFLGLDYDTVGLADVMPLITVLAGYRVYVYLDKGTTGRGVHLYMFLSDPLSQQDAYTVLATIANLSKHWGLPHPEIFPSSSFGPGKGILLPYRGAEEDGYGVNPLTDPINGNFIHLGEVEKEIERTDPYDLLALIDDFSGHRVRSTTPNEARIDTYAGGLQAWESEVGRLKSVWIVSRRQNLALGATAYGIAIGITTDQIRSDIKSLEDDSSDPEVSTRLEAVNSTIEKHAKGERVAWRKYYLMAEVEPPKASRVVPWMVLLKLKALEIRLQNTNFKGVGGFTDLDVLSALIEIGERYGKLHFQGVEVSISVRDLALRARVTKETILNSLKRLENGGWLKRSNRGHGTHSGSLLLLIDADAVDSFEGLEETGEDSTVDIVSIPRFRWGVGKLGKMSKPILENLQLLQPCTRAEVAKAMGRKSRDIKVPLNRLVEYRLVEHDEETNTYYLPENFEDRLFEVHLADGTLATDYKHRKRFERDRDTFKALLAMKRTIRRSMSVI